MNKNYLLALLTLLFIIAVGCWYLIFHWYSLHDHIATPYFALDKVPGHIDSPIIRRTFAVHVVLWIVYLIGFLLLRRLPGKGVLCVGAGAFLCIMFFSIQTYPVGALDVFYYLHTQKLFFTYHLNPYITTFAHYTHDPLWQYSLFKDIPLTYGPYWLVFSWIPYMLFENRSIFTQLVVLKSVNMIYFVLTALLLACFEKRNQEKRQILYLFLFNPLLIFEGVVNAHNDMLATLLLIISLYFLEKKSFASLSFLAMSALVKPFPIILAPLYLIQMFYKQWSTKEILLSFLCLLITIGIGFIPVWSSGDIFNIFLADMAFAQKLNTFSIFSIVRELIVTSPFAAYLPIALIQLNALFLIGEISLIYTYIQNNFLFQTMTDILLLFFLLLSLFQPWYLIALFALLLLSRKHENYVLMFFLTLSGLIFYTGSIWLYFNSGYSVLKVHILQSFFITLPSCIYMCWRLFCMHHVAMVTRKDTLAIHKAYER